MADVVDASTRSRMMAGIRGQHTAPEIAVRRYLHAAGLRFRLHDRRLPGSPDLVLPAYRTAVLVHGCFWHRHPGCRYATTPATRPEFWAAKFSENVDRDRRNTATLEAMGWNVMVVWECETRNEIALDELFWNILAAGTCEAERKLARRLPNPTARRQRPRAVHEG